MFNFYKFGTFYMLYRISFIKQTDYLINLPSIIAEITVFSRLDNLSSQIINMNKTVFNYKLGQY